jgi:DNA invertase Pin-like site-specific DNA recombinase
MAGQRIGYVRVSSFDQNPERQLDGTPVDRTFTDKASGKDVLRPQLEELMRFARTGDILRGTDHPNDRTAARNTGLARLTRAQPDGRH